MADVTFSTECPPGFSLGYAYEGDATYDVPAKLFFLCHNFPENVVFQNPGGVGALLEAWLDINIPGLVNREDNAYWDDLAEEPHWVGRTPTGHAKLGGTSTTLWVIFCSREPTQGEIDQIVNRLETIQPI
jgi:hypothetical protein